jgi:hypothetical protein
VNTRRAVAGLVVVATLLALAGCADASRLVATQRTSAARYYARHASDPRVRECLGFTVKSPKPNVVVRCMMGRLQLPG